MTGKKILKKCILQIAEKSGIEAIRDRLWVRSGTVPAWVLAFHRVSDRIPEDGITISPDRFTAIVEVLSERYRPITLTDLLNSIRRRQIWRERTVVVTFDDGYRDNYEVAAQILLEHQIPATFFITAGLIGTERVLPWDMHLRGRVSWMKWEEVRLLRANGFDIGSHTMTHCDLGKASASEARHEIQDSKRKLEDALGNRISLFAYPFGGLNNITEENRSLIREAGYCCCCSAHGGYVMLGADPFRLPRIPINNWFATIGELDFELRIIAPWRWRL